MINAVRYRQNIIGLCTVAGQRVENAQTSYLSICQKNGVFNDTKQTSTCVPDSIRFRTNAAPSGTAYIATISAHCVKDGVATEDDAQDPHLGLQQCD
jgi:hypothetical protein